MVGKDSALLLKLLFSKVIKHYYFRCTLASG